jgi:hypothetical protein
VVNPAQSLQALMFRFNVAKGTLRICCQCRKEKAQSDRKGGILAVPPTLSLPPERPVSVGMFFRDITTNEVQVVTKVRLVI